MALGSANGLIAYSSFAATNNFLSWVVAPATYDGGKVATGTAGRGMEGYLPGTACWPPWE